MTRRGEMMFIVKFRGGIGNQMYQYAFMRNLQIMYPNTEVYSDVTDYRRESMHNGFELQKVFGIELNKAEDDDIERISGRIPRKTKFRNAIYKVKRRIKNLMLNSSAKNNEVNLIYTEEQPLEYIEKVLRGVNGEQDTYFDGFWQYPECFARADGYLKNEFVFRYDENEQVNYFLHEIERMDIQSVSLHVRRGDYVGSRFECVDLDYYKSAIKIIEDRLNNPCFFIFSDDMNYVEKNFAYLPHKFFVNCNRGINSYMDMMLMSKCKHNIVTNSTFSYWGAHLNCNEDKIVIAPKKDIGARCLIDCDWISL